MVKQRKSGDVKGFGDCDNVLRSGKREWVIENTTPRIVSNFVMTEGVKNLLIPSLVEYKSLKETLKTLYGKSTTFTDETFEIKVSGTFSLKLVTGEPSTVTDMSGRPVRTIEVQGSTYTNFCYLVWLGYSFGSVNNPNGICKILRERACNYYPPTTSSWREDYDSELHFDFEEDCWVDGGDDEESSGYFSIPIPSTIQPDWINGIKYQ